MRRKKIIIAVSVILATVFGGKSLLWAQKPHQEKVQHITERMVKKLDLTQEQKDKVYDINLKKVEAYKKLKDTKGTASRKERKQQFKINISEWKNELKAVLNEKQLKKMRIQ